MNKPAMLVVVMLSGAVWCAVSAAPVAQQPVEYRGSLDPKLVADAPPWDVLSRQAPATDDERARVKIPIGPDERVVVADLSGPVTNLKLRAAFVERAAARHEVLVDLDGDGTWSEQERGRLVPSVDPIGANRGGVEATFDVPTPEGYQLRSYPLRLMLLSREGRAGGGMSLLQSFRVAVQGTVDIAGQRTLVRYAGVSLRTGTIDPHRGDVDVDCNGDGVINSAWSSPESDLASGAPVVFRVGSRFVSTKQVDLATGTIVMREHPASDYDRIELIAGALVPDFGFLDFSGQARKLSDFRGKYLLLDFWGTWCGPCIAAFPQLKAAYERFRGRGFEILGLDREHWEGDAVAAVIEKARAVVAEKGVLWPQARADTIKSTIDRFRIVPYPTYVLLDPNGRIVTWGAEEQGQSPLHGPDLMTTLEKLLPKS